MATPTTPKPSIPVEATEEVNVYRTSATCPCGGSMLPDGYSTPLVGPLGPDSKGRSLYRHACGTCAAPAWYLETYPKVYYVSAAAERRLADAALARSSKGEG